MGMDETNSLINQRKEKLATLRSKGIDPFKNKFAPTEKCAEARANYVEGREVAVAGRLTAHRDMGKSMFIDVRDQSGRLQVYAQKNILGDEQFDIFRHLDLGDFIGARGILFTTKMGEISIRLASFVILAFTRRTLPRRELPHLRCVRSGVRASLKNSWTRLAGRLKPACRACISFSWN